MPAGAPCCVYGTSQLFARPDQSAAGTQGDPDRPARPGDEVDPRAETQYWVLDRTYLRPAPSQEKATELLNLPFSTYRRYRDRGIEAIADWLWDRDIDSTSRA